MIIQHSNNAAAASRRILLILSVATCSLLLCSSCHYQLTYASAFSIEQPHSHIDKATNDETQLNNVTVKDPFRYTRLNWELYSLKIQERFKKQRNYEEKPEKEIVTVNGRIIASPTTYYTNPKMDVANITEDELILEALHQVYRNRIQVNTLFDYDNVEDKRRSSDPKMVNAERCLIEMNYLSERVDELENSRLPKELRNKQMSTRFQPELMSFFNNFGSAESGLLEGNLFWLGIWENCPRRDIFDIQNLTSPDGSMGSTRITSFKGRSCFASIRNPNWESGILLRERELQEIDFFRKKTQHLDYRRYFRIQIGACLPESCDSNILDEQFISNKTLKQMLHKIILHRIPEPYRSYNLTHVYCLPDETSPLRQPDLAGWLLILTLVSWFNSLLLATAAEHYDWVELKKLKSGDKKTLAQKLVVSMSLLESYRSLMKPEKGPTKNQKQQQPLPQPTAVASTSNNNNNSAGVQNQKKPQVVTARISDLTFLHALKAIMMFIIVWSHIHYCMVLFNKRPIEYYGVSNLQMAMYSGISAICVDWFFCLTAFTTSYGIFCSRSVETNTILHWLYTVFQRYWRLAPSYILLFWFYKSLNHLTSSGALWDYGTSTMSQATVCKEASWLTSLTFTQNFYPIGENCMGTSWYIGVDMQLYLITPFILILLHKSPKLAYLICGTLISSSLIGRFYRYMTDVHVRPMTLLIPRYDMTMANNYDIYYTYLRPHYRLSSWLLGLMAGHYTYMVRTGRWSSSFYVNSKHPLNVTTNETSSVASTELEKAEQNASRKRFNWGLFAIANTILVFLTMYGVDLSFPRTWEPNSRPWCAAVYTAGFAFSSLQCSIITSIMTLGSWSKLKKIMERPFWTQLSRINYFVLLIQVNQISWIIQSSTRLMEVNNIELLKFYCFSMVILYSIAFILTLILANPLVRLERELVGVEVRKRLRRRKPQATSGDNSTAAAAEAHKLQQQQQLEPVATLHGGEDTQLVSLVVMQKSTSGGGGAE